ncbi:MAG TPA: divalent metal cation transporter [Bryobacteraceae bacterium]|nr:divalent metal cation transporter [Bryobacteraceae bacterium]
MLTPTTTAPETPKGKGAPTASGGVRRFLENLGPGLITGAADDDPSGISTYSVAGASLGYSPLWTALITFPLMSALQLMCARLALVTGCGVAKNIRKHFPRWVLWAACTLLAIANVTNLAADLGGMAEVTGMVTGSSGFIWTPLYAIGIVALLFWSSYRHIARIFKWLTLVLFAYVFAAFFATPDWRAALEATLVPRIALTRDYLSVLVAILGTTISPYLFFWQAAQEVEEQDSICRLRFARRKPASDKLLENSRVDVVSGMLFSNLIMYFIILTAAATLHAHGQTNIETAKQAAEALRPLAGSGAYWLFSIGLIGTGMLGVPVLAGSCAYAVSEAAGWRRTLARPPQRCPEFYSVIAIAMIGGLALNFVHISAVKMLFFSAVVNGVLAPPLVLLVVLLTCDRRVMADRVNSPLLRWLGWATFVFMTAAAVAMLVV